MQGAEACEGLRDPRTRGGNAGIDQELAVSTGEDSNIAAGAFRSLWTLIGAVAGFSRSRFILTSKARLSHTGIGVASVWKRGRRRRGCGPSSKRAGSLSSASNSALGRHGSVGLPCQSQRCAAD